MSGKYKEGDWYCGGCGDHQFARNVKCRMCGASKPLNIKSKAANRMMRGDWICAICNSHQFARRRECRDCGAVKGAKSTSNKNSVSFKPSKQYILVMDFEANCSSEQDRDHEIIEFPAVLIDTSTYEKVGQFREFVKLVKTERLSEFIKNLTHITDEQICNGLEWEECLKQFEEWCHGKNLTPLNTTIVTCGNWDLKTMLDRQLTITQTRLSEYLNRLFSCFNNVKNSFQRHANKPAKGMTGMLEHFHLNLEGHHHSGIDDSNNIAKVCVALLRDGCDVSAPNRIRLKKWWYETEEDKLPYTRNKKGRIMPNF